MNPPSVHRPESLVGLGAHIGPRIHVHMRQAADLRSCANGNEVIFLESTTEQVTIVRALHSARDISEVLKPT